MSGAQFAWLGTDKAPLYVCMFFAALAWTLVSTADRVAAPPLSSTRSPRSRGPFNFYR